MSRIGRDPGFRSFEFSNGETFIFSGNPDIGFLGPDQSFNEIHVIREPRVECGVLMEEPLEVFEDVTEINRRVLAVMTMRLENDLKRIGRR